jgi:hypothetical protein
MRDDPLKMSEALVRWYLTRYATGNEVPTKAFHIFTLSFERIGQEWRAVFSTSWDSMVRYEVVSDLDKCEVRVKVYRIENTMVCNMEDALGISNLLR